MNSCTSLARALAASFVIHIFLLTLGSEGSPPRSYSAPLTVFLAKTGSPSDSGVPMPIENAPPVGGARSLENDAIVELTKRDDAPVSPPPRLDQYFRSNELTHRPLLLNPEWLEDVVGRFPAQVSGDVTLTLKIGRDGAVDAVEVYPAGSEFADWLEKEFPRLARFSPAERQGIPVSSQIRLRFSLAPAAR